MASVDANYMTAWGFRGDAHQLVDSVECSLTRSTQKCDPHLVVQIFRVHGNSILVHGNLRIRIPTGVDVSIATRKRVVQEALRNLEYHAMQHTEVSATAAIVLVGDANSACC